ncbi:MAG: hypothetical protein FWC92_08705 [Defluviitaleaceae bacterium]|nr:hypothetical protein [Defluviitaleaceae bacterium]
MSLMQTSSGKQASGGWLGCFGSIVGFAGVFLAIFLNLYHFAGPDELGMDTAVPFFQLLVDNQQIVMYATVAINTLIIFALCYSLIFAASVTLQENYVEGDTPRHRGKTLAMLILMPAGLFLAFIALDFVLWGIGIEGLNLLTTLDTWLLVVIFVLWTSLPRWIKATFSWGTEENTEKFRDFMAAFWPVLIWLCFFLVGLAIVVTGIIMLMALFIIMFPIGAILCGAPNLADDIAFVISGKTSQTRYRIIAGLYALACFVAIALPLGMITTGRTDIVIGNFGTAETGLTLPLSTTSTTHMQQGSGPHYQITHSGDLRTVSWTSRDGFTFTYIDSNVRSIELIGTTVFYIKNDNSLWGYGSNSNGLLGIGTTIDQDEPVRILDNVIELQVDKGLRNWIIYALRADRTLWRWGNGELSPVLVTEDVANFFGTYANRPAIQKTNGFIFSLPNVTRVFRFPMLEAVGLHDRLSNTSLFYINEDGTLYQRAARARGRGSAVAENVKSLWGDYNNLHFITTDGSLWGIGNNREGQLGDGTTISRAETPVRIASNVVRAGNFFYVTANGELWTWSSINPNPAMSLSNVALTLNMSTSHASATGRTLDGTIQLNDGSLIMRYATWRRSNEDHSQLRYAAGEGRDVHYGVRLPQVIVIE